MYIPKMKEKIGTTSAPDEALRSLITRIIKESGKSRTDIAEKLSVHVGQPISQPMLDDWTAESKKRARFPACFVQAFSEVTEDDQLQRHLLSERLLDLLAIGESVAEAAGSLKRAQDAVASIVEQGRGKKAEHKQAPKA